MKKGDFTNNQKIQNLLRHLIDSKMVRFCSGWTKDDLHIHGHLHSALYWRNRTLLSVGCLTSQTNKKLPRVKESN